MALTMALTPRATLLFAAAVVLDCQPRATEFPPAAVELAPTAVAPVPMAAVASAPIAVVPVWVVPALAFVPTAVDVLLPAVAELVIQPKLPEDPMPLTKTAQLGAVVPIETCAIAGTATVIRPSPAAASATRLRAERPARAFLPPADVCSEAATHAPSERFQIERNVLFMNKLPACFEAFVLTME
ncbi:MAG TPA: hypothetical protein VGM74_17230 [Burkholderiaceae bacterium]